MLNAISRTSLPDNALRLLVVAISMISNPASFRFSMFTMQVRASSRFSMITITGSFSGPLNSFAESARMAGD
jgi:hypothetical protein